jgi:hypothetical protein
MKDAPNRCERNAQSGYQDQRPFDATRKVFRFFVPVGMILIRRLRRNRQRNQRNNRRRQVDQRLQRIGQQTNRTGDQIGASFQRNRYDCCRDRQPCKTGSVLRVHS